MLIFIYIDMLAIAGQTAGPNGLKLVEGTLEYPVVTTNKG